MKKIFIFSTLLLPLVQHTYAQKGYAGLWEGKLKVGMEVQLAFRISSDGDTLSATLNVPDQGIKDLKLSSASAENDSIKLVIGQFGAFFIGKLINDTTISGRFVQQSSIPLQLKKVDRITTKTRPQTPVPPFPYKSEDITYRNPGNSITYGATITVPNGNAPFPAVILLTGSGQQNRDEEIAGHKPFAVIADHLTRNGFIVLRVDDRGMGQTTGYDMSVTSQDFAKDAIVGLNYLLSRKEVDKKRVGLIGHSEGGMIAQLVAAERPEVSFIISLAGPGQKNIDLMHDQNRETLFKSGMSKEYIDKYAQLYDSTLAILIHHDKKDFEANLTRLVDDWLKVTPKNIAIVTTGIKDEQSKENFVKTFSAQANNDWFRYFVSYNPEENLKEFRGHYLALNGDKDIQVISKPNLSAIENALKNGKAKSYEIHELKGLNHLFQECKICNTAEYVQLEQTISPQVLELMTSWLKRISSTS